MYGVRLVLTFESADEILWCDHSSETSSAVLLHATICFSIFCKIKFAIILEFGFVALLGVKGPNNNLRDVVFARVLKLIFNR